MHNDAEETQDYHDNDSDDIDGDIDRDTGIDHHTDRLFDEDYNIERDATTLHEQIVHNNLADLDGDLHDNDHKRDHMPLIHI